MGTQNNAPYYWKLLNCWLTCWWKCYGAMEYSENTLGCGREISKAWNWSGPGNGLVKPAIHRTVVGSQPWSFPKESGIWTEPSASILGKNRTLSIVPVQAKETIMVAKRQMSTARTASNFTGLFMGRRADRSVTQQAGNREKLSELQNYNDFSDRLINVGYVQISQSLNAEVTAPI